MDDLQLIKDLYEGVNVRYLKGEQGRQRERDDEEYFDVKVLRHDQRDDTWVVRYNGGDYRTTLVGNTTPKISEVVTMYLPKGAVRGQINTKARS